jgi:hypothetical protein
MNMVWHDDEGVEFVCACCAVVLERFDEKLGVAFNLKETTAVICDRGHEESAFRGGSLRDGHGLKS